jgi:predicted branched-subunit amino acid permease
MTVPDVYTLTRRGLWQGARASVPLGVASAVLGAGFGVAARQVDLALWATLFMSGSVFAGAAQFAVLPLWSAPLPLAPIWFSTFAVNARFALLSASLTSWLRHGSRPACSAKVSGPSRWAPTRAANAIWACSWAAARSCGSCG